MSQALRLFDPDGDARENDAMPDAQTKTIRQVISRYLEHCTTNNRHCPEAADERRRTLNLFADWTPPDAAGVLGDRAVDECAAHHLEDWIEGHNSWASPSTKRSKANEVNACFNWAARSKRVADNPFSGVTYEEAEPRRPMAEEAFEAFLEAANKRFGQAILFLRLTGCRLSDLFRLEWIHIVWEHAMPNGAVVAFALLPIHKSKKKTGKPKTIPLVPEAIELLRKIQAEASGTHEGFVFRNNRGKQWNRRTLGQQLRRMKERLGLDCPATLHGIRHFWGSNAVARGAQLTFVSKGMGHASQAITEKHYLHVDQDFQAILEAAKLGAARGIKT